MTHPKSGKQKPTLLERERVLSDQLAEALKACAGMNLVSYKSTLDAKDVARAALAQHAAARSNK